MSRVHYLNSNQRYFRILGEFSRQKTFNLVSFGLCQSRLIKFPYPDHLKEIIMSALVIVASINSFDAAKAVDDRTLMIKFACGTQITINFGNPEQMQSLGHTAIVTGEEEAGIHHARRVPAIIPHIPEGAGTEQPTIDLVGSETDDELSATLAEDFANVANLDDSDDDSEATHSIGDVGLTQELNF